MNQNVARRLPAGLIRWLVRFRSAAQILIEPIDRLGLKLNGKSYLPPLWLRRYVGPLNAFETSGAEFACLLKLLAGLRADSAVCDIGCGCGALALPLADYLGPNGRYLGIDIHRPSIDWCRSHITRAGFSFMQVDMYNAAYNPRGAVRPQDFTLPEPDRPFDVIVAKSLFTHLTPDATRAYLRLARRFLAPHGTLLFTCFTFSGAPQSGTQPGAKIDFRYGDDEFRHAYAHRVEAAVAYHEQLITRLADEAGLALAPIRAGAWQNSADPLSFQDVILARRKEDAG